MARVSTCHPDKPHKGHGLCGACWQRERRKNPEIAAKRSELQRNYYQANRPALLEKEKARRATSREARRKYNRVYRLKTRYGITESDYDQLLSEQGGRCEICGKRPRTKRLAVDHDHTIEREVGITVVRGLLCGPCNRAIGKFEWDKDVIERAINYLGRITELRNQYLSGKGTH